MNKRERKKSSSKKGKTVGNGPGSKGYLADITRESEMSVIAVYGNALDKLGFEIARKANRNAEKRLTKTLNVYDDMASKNNAKYRKEKYELKDKMAKLRLNQQRVWREYANRRVDEDGTTATGILFRRAKLLERSGILGEEEERQTEEEVRMEAARLVEKGEIEGDKEVNNCDVADGNPWWTEQDEAVSDELLGLENQPDVQDCIGAHWINLDNLMGAAEFYVPGTKKTDDAIEFSGNNQTFPDVLYDTEYDHKTDKGEIQVKGRQELCTDNEGEDDSSVETQNRLVIEDEKVQLEKALLAATDYPLKRLHTSPMITVKEKNNYIKDSTKTRINFTVTLPDMVINSTTDYKIKDPSSINEDNTNENREYEETYAGNAQQSLGEEERRLLHRKQTVHSDMIQAAYFGSKTVETKITPPQIRPMASPFGPVHQSTDTNSYRNPRNTKNVSPMFRNFSSLGGSIYQGTNRQTSETLKNTKILKPTLRCISTPNPPSPASVFHSRSPSPVASPESIRGKPSSQLWLPVQESQRLKKKLLLESRLYVPSASKHEKRHIVPDKREMLIILEDEKKELQKRIDRFLARQIRQPEVPLE